MAFLQGDTSWVTVSLAASGVRSVGGVCSASNRAIKILEYCVSHDGNTSGNAPDITDFARCTFGNNAPGTNSTSADPSKKDPGRGETVQTSGAYNWTTEATTITAFKRIHLAQYNGLYHHIVPFAAPFIVVTAQGFVVRQNSPNTVNSTGSIEIEE